MMQSPFIRPIFLPKVGIAGTTWKPARRRPMISQIEVNPEINAPINIGLGSLPMVIGSASAGALSLLAAYVLPDLRNPLAVLGLGFLGFSVYNIFSKDGSGITAEAPGTISPTGGEGGAISPPIAETNEDAFPLLEGRIVSPGEWQKVNLGFFGSKVDIRTRLTNPSSSDVTFDLIYDVEEIPSPFGDVEKYAVPTRVTLGAGETRDVDSVISLVTWGTTTNEVDVYITLQKRRISGGAPALLSYRHFVID